MPDEANPETAFVDAAAAANTAPPAAPPEAPPAPEPPVSPPVDTAPPVNTAPPAQPTPGEQIISYVQQQGIDTSQFETVQEVVDSLVQQAQQGQAALAFAQQHMQQPSETPAETPQPSETPAAEWSLQSHLREAWNVPSQDPKWAGMINSGVVQRNPASGLYEPAPGNEWLAQSPMLADLNAYEASVSQADRLEQIWNAFEVPLQRMLEEKLGSTLSDRDQQAAAEQAQQAEQQALDAFKANAQLFAAGQPTQLGQRIIDAADQLQEASGGAIGTARALELAQNHIGVPAQANGHGGNGATPPPATPEQASTEQAQSFLEQSLSAASHSPSAGSGIASHPPGQEPAPMTEDELKTLFIRRFQEQEAGAA